MSPASWRNLLRIRDLAWRTAFSVSPSSSATRAAGRPSRANRWNADHVDGWKSDCTIESSFRTTYSSCSRSNSPASSLSGSRHPVEESVGQVQPDGRPPHSLLDVVPGPVRGHLPQPCAERPLATPIEPGQLADHDDEHLLGQVDGLVAQAGHAAEPSHGSMAGKCLAAGPSRTRPAGPP